MGDAFGKQSEIKISHDNKYWVEMEIVYVMSIL